MRSTLVRLAMAITVLAAGCSESTPALQWWVDVEPSRDEVVAFEATVTEGDCTSSNTPFYREVFGPDEMPPPPPLLGPGQYAFRVVAVSPTCEALGCGCQARTLPDSRGDLELAVLPPPTPGACTPTLPLSGVCTPGDAGVDAPAPTCDDLRMNGDELGVDCGGSCTPCPCMTSPCVETGLVGHWPFELSLDDTVGDSDGRRLGGTPTYVAGVAGMAISLDGNGDAVAVEGASALTAFQSDVFTIVGWARHRPKAESEPRFLWSVDEDGDRDLHYLGYKSSPTFQCRNGTSDGRSNIEINVGNPTTAETWHHFAVTSSDPGIWAFYFDGCLVGAAGPDHRLRLSGAQCFVMGGEQRNACVLGSADMAWNGEIDEVSVFDRILSPDEIAFSASLATSEIPVCPGG